MIQEKHLLIVMVFMNIASNYPNPIILGLGKGLTVDLEHIAFNLQMHHPFQFNTGWLLPMVKLLEEHNLDFILYCNQQ